MNPKPQLKTNGTEFYWESNEPIAYGMFKDCEFYDAIHPKQYTEHIGSYNIPLYTHPVKELTDEEIVELGENTLPNEAIGFVPMWQWIDFARAILRKAQEK